MKRRNTHYTDIERAWIKAHSRQPRRKMHAAFCMEFGRDDISLQSITALCKRNGWLTGRNGCFEKGSVPANKGKPQPYNANSARTQFKKGQVPPNTKPLGHEGVSKDGYVLISIQEVNPHTGFERRYVHKHVHLWIQTNGPVPKGMVLKCLDGDKANTDPNNWEAIPRAMLPRLNGRWPGLAYDTAAAELKPAILQTARLEHKARVLRRKGASDA